MPSFTTFESGRIVSVSRNGSKVFSVTFELLGQTFYALNGGPTFGFSRGFRCSSGAPRCPPVAIRWLLLRGSGACRRRWNSAWIR